MERSELKELYRKLMSNKFNFIDRKERSIEEIYKSVKAFYPELCDDSYLCSMHCSQRHDQPEWKHRVRGALDSLKRSGEVEKSINTELQSKNNHW